MKRMLPFLVLSVLLFASCGSEPQHHDSNNHDHDDQNDHHGQHANEHMNRKIFEQLVKDFESPERLQWQKPDEVVALLGNITDKTILDIGSGTGYFSFRMADAGATVIAADVDDRFLEYIQNKKKEIGTDKVKTRKTKFDDPLLQAEEIHHAIIVNTYHHIDDRVNYFGKVAQGMKPDGSLLVVDYKQTAPMGPPPKHRIAARQVIEELTQAGFTDFQTNEELLDNQYVIIAN